MLIFLKVWWRSNTCGNKKLISHKWKSKWILVIILLQYNILQENPSFWHSCDTNPCWFPTQWHWLLSQDSVSCHTTKTAQKQFKEHYKGCEASTCLKMPQVQIWLSSMECASIIHGVLLSWRGLLCLKQYLDVIYGSKNIHGTFYSEDFLLGNGAVAMRKVDHFTFNLKIISLDFYDIILSKAVSLSYPDALGMLLEWRQRCWSATGMCLSQTVMH